MIELFREFFWLIFPILGMGIAFMAVAGEFGRQKKALEVLRTYAEKGVRAAGQRSGRAQSRQLREQKESEGEFRVLHDHGPGLHLRGWLVQRYRWLVAVCPGFAIASFVMAALAVSNLVQAMSKNSSANGE